MGTKGLIFKSKEKKVLCRFFVEAELSGNSIIPIPGEREREMSHREDVCVCVSERERERESVCVRMCLREREGEREIHQYWFSFLVSALGIIRG